MKNLFNKLGERLNRVSSMKLTLLAVLSALIVGAFIIIAMQQYFAGFGQWVLVIQGVIFVACVLSFRRGIIGELAHWLRIKL